MKKVLISCLILMALISLVPAPTNQSNGSVTGSTGSGGGQGGILTTEEPIVEAGDTCTEYHECGNGYYLKKCRMTMVYSDPVCEGEDSTTTGNVVGGGSYGTLCKPGTSEQKCVCNNDEEMLENCEELDEYLEDRVCCKYKIKPNDLLVTRYTRTDYCIDSEGYPKEVVDNEFCEEISIETKIQNRIKVGSTECPEECTCSGSTVTCVVEGQRRMEIHAGDSGNLIMQVKGVNAVASVTLYKKEDGKVYGEFENEEKEIKIFPDEAKEKAEEKLKDQVIEDEVEINLDENGEYQVKTKKKSKLFWIFPVKEKVRVQVNSQTGETTESTSSWWGFLARDKKE